MDQAAHDMRPTQIGRALHELNIGWISLLRTITGLREPGISIRRLSDFIRRPSGGAS